MMLRKRAVVQVKQEVDSASSGDDDDNNDNGNDQEYFPVANVKKEKEVEDDDEHSQSEFDYDDDNDSEFLNLSQRTNGPNHRTKGPGGRPRKYKTDEERRKAEAERKRRQRATLSEEKRKEMSRKQVERRKERFHQDPEFHEEYKRKNAERRRLHYYKDLANESKSSADEEKRTSAAERKRLHRATLSKEEREEMHRKQVERRRERFRQNPELYEEYKRKNRERRAKYRAELSKDPIKRERELSRKREWRRANPNDPDKREKELRRKRELYHLTKEKRKKKKKPLTEEERQKHRMRNKLLRQRQSEEAKKLHNFANYCRLQTKLSQMTEEEVKAYKEAKAEYARNWRNNLPPERQEEHREYLRKRAKERYERLKNDPEGMDRLKNYLLVYQRRKTAKETPEQRQKRLRRYKVYQAGVKLRKQLEEMGLPPNEVDERVAELKRQMEAEPLPPVETLSTYKPRVQESENEILPRGRRGRPFTSFPSSCGTSRSCDSSRSQGEESSLAAAKTQNDDSHHFEFDNDSHFDDFMGCSDSSSNYFNETVPGISSTRTASTSDVEQKLKTETPKFTEPELKMEVTPTFIQFDFKCSFCSSIYSERSDLLAHIGTDHQKECWKCPMCKLIVLSSSELQDHFKAEHFPGKQKPATATTSTKSEPEPEVQSKVVPQLKSPNKTKFSCIKCDPLSSQSETSFEKLQDLMEHVKLVHPEYYFPCLKCNILKYTESSLKLHRKVCGNLKPNIKKINKSSKIIKKKKRS